MKNIVCHGGIELKKMRLNDAVQDALCIEKQRARREILRQSGLRPSDIRRFKVDGYPYIWNMANNPLPYDASVIANVNAFTTLLNGGFIKIYTGAQPALNGAVTGTLLATMTFSAQINPPGTASGSTVATGGTVAAGVYHFVVTYVNASGETTASEYGTVTTTGATSTLTINSPSAATGATGWYAYVTQAGGNSAYQATRQQAAGSPTAIGTNLTLTAPPTTTGASPPSVNTTGAFAIATASAGLVTGSANAITSGTAGNTGTAGYHVLQKSDGVTIVATGSVGTSNADLNMNTLSVVSGNTVSCSSYLVTEAEA